MAKSKKKKKGRKVSAEEMAARLAQVIGSAASAVATPGARAVNEGSKKPNMGGRVTVDADVDPFSRFTFVVAPPDAEQAWRTMSLDDQTLDRLPVTRLIEYLCDLSPDISKAVWDYQRLINPGYKITVMKPNSKTEDKAATEALNTFLSYLKDEYGGFDVIINRMSIAGYLRGAFLAELVLNKNGTLPIDFVTPDPAIIRFKRESDPERGYKWVMGQYQRGQFVDFVRPTIRYVPIDPYPDKPYGRPLVSPALFSTLFLLGLLHDLRRVVSQQGYPRIDISISLEKLKAAMPDDIENDSTAVKEWIDGAINEVKSIYRALQPDDAYVHLDPISVNRPVGTVDSDSLGAIGELIKALERMSVRALKTMPLMMGTTDGVSEANANRQWEIFIAGIKSIQHLLETLLERLLGLALEAQGIAGVVTFRFAEVRAAELLRDAQVEQQQIANERDKYNMGYTTLDEGAERLTGHKAVEKAPRVATTGSQGSATNPARIEADPGSNRFFWRIRTKHGVIRLQGVRETVTPEGADNGTLPIPGTVEVSDAEFNRYLRQWAAEAGDTYSDLLEAEVVESEAAD